jgi:hypothetical protein
MAEERRKGAPDRRSRTTKTAQAGEQRVTSPGGSPGAEANEATRASNPNEDSAFAADQLDESIRARQREERGEVF